MTGVDPNLQAAGVPFAEAASHARFASVSKLLPESASLLLAQFLAESANPDRSILQLEVLLQSHAAEAVPAFTSSALALQGCVALFGSSPWLGQSLLQNPDLLQLFARPAGLTSARLAEELHEQFARFRLRCHELALPVLLARFKRREYVRIYTRELLGLASLAEITGEISALADVLIGEALAASENELRRRYQGWPQVRSLDGRISPARFCVLALGKLGGDELNYSSDVDLLYLCDDLGDAGTVSITAREFFTRLAQDLTAVLSNVSVEGQAFRVDLRLRPQGASGEVVVGCHQALHYYQQDAHDWELQALLKLRFSAGDAALAREFEAQVQELIYREPLTLAAIRTAARSLDRIHRGASRQPALGSIDVKNGSGGLREIEFVAQCLQRVHGGREAWLRSGGTLSALQKLHDKGHIAHHEFRELCETYALLRAIEHRLQCRQGAASHRLPQSAAEQRALFRSLPAKWASGARELRERMDSAADLCARVLRLGEGQTASAQVARLGSSGMERLMRGLAECSPTLAQALHSTVGDAAARNLQRFLAAAATGEERITATIANAESIERALPVFAVSSFATDILSRYPADIAALFASPEVLASADADFLRRASRRCSLRNVGSTILERRPVWDVLQEYSSSFDQILQQATATVEPPEGFAVFSLGRLGTCELDALSDVDLLFLRTPGCDAERAGHCARALVTLLSGYTREGSVVAMDARLRPHGEEGELVSSVRQFAQYCENEAQPWEALAFAKLRFCGGDESLSGEAVAAVQALRRRFASSVGLTAQLRATRKRLEDAAGPANFKAGPGGLYDLDYLLGLLEIRSELMPVGLQLRERLEVLTNRAALSQEQHSCLLRAADLFRRVDHVIRILEGRSRRWLPQGDAVLAQVERLCSVEHLEQDMRAEMAHVRALFDCFFQD